jgi:4-hydroxy-L-threonine phosphate dehydrogenase PdxA
LATAPCWPRNESTPCPDRDWITQEEIDAKEAEALNDFKAMVKARNAIVADGKFAGIVECPVCKGKLKYSKAACNGHIHAACENGDLSWME